MESILAGTVQVEITSADVGALLTELNRWGISFWNLQYADSLTVRLQIMRTDIHMMRSCIARRGGTIKIVKSSGLYWKLKGFLKRPLLIVGAVLILFLIFWIPTKVLFITVEGNEQIPTKYIIEQANLCGISFGASRREVRSEKMKNNLMAAIPSLQWAGINTSGCTAVISVKERAVQQIETERSQVSSIVAARDGVIESCTAQSGNQLCKVGQAVKSGDVLISAYTDCGFKINATRAEGEVFAQTRHELTVLTPMDFRQKGEEISVKKKYGILLGKKRINFYKGSGILGAGCDKIYSEYYVKLPGGFQLPVALFVITVRVYDESVAFTTTELAETTARTYAQQYLLSHMISGNVLQDRTITQYQADVCILQGEYVCSEMIGRVRNEETIGNYGEDHGENR